MATTATQIAANRENAQLSTGPRTSEGKLASSTNARTHGLTSRQALLPTEDPSDYLAHLQAYAARYRPNDPLHLAAVAELADLHWRLRRVTIFEAQLISIEFNRLKTDPELAPLIQDLQNDHQIQSLAFSRLIASKVLSNLYNQEARLARRAEKLERQLQSVQTAPAAPVAAPPVPQIQKIEPIRVPLQPGRNQLCPCHSGRKFKHCCLNRPQTTGTSTPSQAS